MNDERAGDQSESGAPDAGSAGDVTTTGLSGLETGGVPSVTDQAGPTTGQASAHAIDHHGHDDLDDLDDLDDEDDGHGGGHGGHGDDASEVSTLVPTTWR